MNLPAAVAGPVTTSDSTLPFSLKQKQLQMQFQDPDGSGARIALLEADLSCLWPSNASEDVIRSVTSNRAAV